MLRRIKGFTLIELLIVVAIIAILAAIAVPNFLEAQTRSKVSRVKADQRTLTTALESYYIDNNSYPAFSSSAGQTGYGANAGLADPGRGARYMPTFRVKSSVDDPIATLTTPISYITSFFADPFADSKGATFSYSTFSAGWIMWSYGPDNDEMGGQTDYAQAGGNIKLIGPNGDGQPYVEETTYDPAIQSQPNLINATYDPSNGTTSKGDVWRVKQ